MMTVDYVEDMHDKWLPFEHGEFTIEEIIKELDQVGETALRFRSSTSIPKL